MCILPIYLKLMHVNEFLSSSVSKQWRYNSGSIHSTFPSSTPAAALHEAQQEKDVKSENVLTCQDDHSQRSRDVVFIGSVD